MRRPIIVLSAVLIVTPALAQSPKEMAETARFVAAFQNPDGGFAGQVGGASSLGAASSAVRTLKFVGGSIPDPDKCRAYVLSCYDAEAGGFASTPKGKTDVRTTAVGLMAAVELKTSNEQMVKKAVEYFSTGAKEFEDVRIAVAGLEAVAAKSPDFPRWTEQINKDRNPDGTWGTGGGQARATGSATAALLRMGVEPDKRDAVVAALKAGQRPDGGWSRDGGVSDLETSYRVMRALFMLKEAPDLDRLRAYISKHRQSDGGYASKLGEVGGGGTYYCSIINHWARRLAGEPAVVETAGFVPLFDGKTLDGWEGDTMLWSARDGMLVGKSPGLKRNDFLATNKSYRDFILKFTFRLIGDDESNSGVQLRSVRVPGHEMSGYQADIGGKFWGCLYDESRRNRVLAPASPKALASVNKGGWNHYQVRAVGDGIRLTLNGETSVDYREDDPKIARDGKIAVQIHGGGPMEIQFKDMYIQELPNPSSDGDADTPGFHLRTLKTDGGERKYSVYLPKDYDGKATFPVVLFLHGAGERGEDGVVSAQVGLGPNIRPDDFLAIAVFPQARKTWQTGSEDADAALAALDDVLKVYKGDPKKVVLTGLSMGGAGSWGLGAAHPKRFKAVVPVCGFGDPKTVASLKDTPVWTLLGDADNDRIVLGTRSMVEALRSAGAKPRLTEYRGVGHNSWDRAYSDAELIDWMLR